MLLVFTTLNTQNAFAQLELSDTLRVYELVHDGKTYSVFTINRTDRSVVSAYQDYLTDTLLTAARIWYLGLHEKEGSFTNPEAIIRDFTTGSESLHDGRSTFSIILEGKAQDLVNELVAQERIIDNPENFYRGMIRVSTASHQHPLPPFYGRLKALPEGFNGVNNPEIIENDWAELKNFAQDSSLKIDFLPLALNSLAESGWSDLGGYLKDKTTGEIFLQGDPRLIDETAWEATEIGDAYEMYHQTDIHEQIFGPAPDNYQSSQVGQYYLEVLVPDSEQEGISDPKKAKGLLAYYYKLGFNVLGVTNDPTQPNTKVVIAGIDREGWFKIIESFKRRKGLELLKVPAHEINFNSPNEATRVQSSALSCKKFLN